MQRHQANKDQEQIVPSTEISQQGQVISYLGLPKDVFKYLLGYCDFRSIVRLGQANKALQALITQLPDKRIIRLNGEVEFTSFGTDPVCVQPAYARGTYSQIYCLLSLSNMNKRVAQIDKSIINSDYINGGYDNSGVPWKFIGYASLASGYIATQYLQHIEMLTAENYRFALVAIEMFFFAVSMGGIYGCRYVNKRNKEGRGLLSLYCKHLSPRDIGYLHDDVLELDSSVEASTVTMGRFKFK